MIGSDDDESRARERREAMEQWREGLVDERHLTVVRLRGVPRGEFGGGAVRRVRVEHVNPFKELALLLADPVHRPRDDEIRPPLGHRDLDRPARFRHLVVVEVEAGRQPEAFRQGKSADESAGREPVRLESRRDGRRARLDAEPAVVPDAVLIGKQSRQDGGVGRKRHYGVSVGERETRAVRGEPVDVGSLRRTTVGRQGVGPQCVDGHEQDVLLGVANDREGTAAWPDDVGRDGDDRHHDGEQHGTRSSRGQSGSRISHPPTAAGRGYGGSAAAAEAGFACTSRALTTNRCGALPI